MRLSTNIPSGPHPQFDEADSYTSMQMSPAIKIRSAIAQVFELREQARNSPDLADGVVNVKHMQALRFKGMYADLLASDDFSAPSQFFLDELYGPRDFSDRDAQFARIAGSLSVFPESVIATAVCIAEMHALTEQLDQELAVHWLRFTRPVGNWTADGYVQAWRSMGRRADRELQLNTVMVLGQQLSELTRKPGLATLLKLMRRPAASAGLSSLQVFLEDGFSIFGAMARAKGKSAKFLETVHERERYWINNMFDHPLAHQVDELKSLIKVK